MSDSARTIPNGQISIKVSFSIQMLQYVLFESLMSFIEGHFTTRERVVLNEFLNIVLEIRF